MELTTKISKGEKYYVARCPELRVTTQGKTMSEARKNLKEAMTGILECMIENNVPIPQEDNSVEFIHQIELKLPHAKTSPLQAQRAC